MAHHALQECNTIADTTRRGDDNATCCRKAAGRVWEELEHRRNEGGPAKVKKRRKVCGGVMKILTKQSGKKAKQLRALSEQHPHEKKPEG
jgi:hypothetical protein